MAVIYQITCLATGDRYIGGTAKRLKDRKNEHVCALRAGYNHTKDLQAAWDQYGECLFVFSVLEECPAGVVKDRERHHIDSIRPEYNVLPVNEDSGSNAIVSFRLSRRQCAAIEACAAYRRVSRSEVAREAIEAYLKQLEEVAA